MLLSLLILVPILGAIAIAFVPRESASTVRWLALGAALVDFAIAAVVVLGFQVGQPGLQFVEQSAWVPSWVPSGAGAKPKNTTAAPPSPRARPSERPR